MTRSEFIEIEHLYAKIAQAIEASGGTEDEDVEYYMGVAKTSLKEAMYALEDKAFYSKMNLRPYSQSDFI